MKAQKEEFKIEKVSNMIMVIHTKSATIFKVWEIENLTQRKLNNCLKKLESQYLNGITVIKAY